MEPRRVKEKGGGTGHRGKKEHLVAGGSKRDFKLEEVRRLWRSGTSLGESGRPEQKGAGSPRRTNKKKRECLELYLRERGKNREEGASKKERLSTARHVHGANLESRRSRGQPKE